MRIHCFHGFLGQPEDFAFLSECLDLEVIAHDMRTLCAKGKERAFDKVEVLPDDIFIGYSFGARFALEMLATKLISPTNKLFMLAGHAGLSHDEKIERLEVEKNFLLKVESLKFKEFLKWWNELELFQHDSPIYPALWSQEELRLMFEEFGLSKQKNCLSFVRENKDKIFWACGRLDKKYFNYTKNVIEPLGVDCAYLEAGHRLLQKPDSVCEYIKNKLEEL